METIKLFDKCYKHTTDKVFVKSDKSEVYGNILYSPTETPDVIELSEEEANKIKEEIENKLNAQYKAL